MLNLNEQFMLNKTIKAIRTRTRLYTRVVTTIRAWNLHHKKGLTGAEIDFIARRVTETTKEHIAMLPWWKRLLGIYQLEKEDEWL